jgi:hypothetical protein
LKIHFGVIFPFTPSSSKWSLSSRSHIYLLYFYTQFWGANWTCKYLKHIIPNFVL